MIIDTSHELNDGYSEIAIHHTRRNKHHFEYYVDYFRQLTLYGTLPQTENLLIMVFCSIVSFLLGVAVFKKKQDRFILFI